MKYVFGLFPLQQYLIELPGGRVEEFESFLDALRREVFEEAGLELFYIEGEESRLEAQGVATRVECLAPFCTYQTLQGPVVDGCLLSLPGQGRAAFEWRRQ